jgi:hypothetical protein
MRQCCFAALPSRNTAVVRFTDRRTLRFPCVQARVENCRSLALLVSDAGTNQWVFATRY